MRKRNEMVLLYEIENPERARKIKMIFLKMGVRIKVVTREEYKESLAYVAKLKDAVKREEKYDGEPLGEEMMVLVGFSSSRIDTLLFEFRKAKLEKINLKAVLTEYNRAWNSIELFQELKEEHKKMTCVES